ncbi:hypothetical protein BJF93_16655 [Xaviernesmea oryzae]|uniref:Uncharacterized protein n=1 Tax=Xaviernesmea oryzae TaxID=464029 RepID=A0A1Q9AT54_9HYPH|nr:hypothetical protein [Xaviernesmea oryzae]OLP58495.1 hypothetical protein BJF93_16655 [Xaviernesmea oryzae]SEK59230.1 hypothetical protein SAMN04487976_10335 [Xaviernesmea oryzae]
MTSPAAATSMLAASARAQGCEEAIRPAFEKLVADGTLPLATAIGPDLPQSADALVKTAQAEGWSRDEAEEAIRNLAHERLGAQGSAID